ncbi:MAG: hypothetical protein RBR86_03525 [Pseudobdellovibrionaceae bacterium]|jgi:antitoxin component YwqK of YwqJK toxin-antitoxin module|nr:hypothetical protein [Pseudobdellovibrionaceae bacterium]
MSDFIKTPPDKNKNKQVEGTKSEDRFGSKGTDTFNNSADRRRRGVHESKSSFPLPLAIFLAMFAIVFLVKENNLFDKDIEETLVKEIKTITEKPSKKLSPVEMIQQADQLPPEHILKEACLWKKNFNIETDIEPIEPTDYMRDFWPNDTPRSVEPTVNGLRHGIGHYTFANGNLYGDIPWNHGEKHGTFALFREDGTLDQVLSYKNGHLYGINQWFNASGHTITSWLYIDNDTYYPTLACAKYLSYQEEYGH